MKVGIFDSGLGGLTVLKELLKVSKGIEFYYLGDTARVPYGIRSEETVKRYSLECTLFLKNFDIDLLVIACNTASAKAGDFLRKKFPELPIFDVINPAVEEVLSLNPKAVGVIGTPSTVESGIYRKKIFERNPNINVLQKATPLLVPLVEEGFLKGVITQEVLKHYLSQWEDEIELLLLGCTHYPLLKEEIKKLFPHWALVDSALPLAKFLKPKLQQVGDNRVRLFFTDKTAFLEKMLKNTGLNGGNFSFEVVNLDFKCLQKDC